MKRSLAWIGSIIFILGTAGPAVAGYLDTFIIKSYVVSGTDATEVYDKGVSHARDGNYRKAQQFFEAAVRKDSKHVDALSYLSTVYANNRQYDEAIRTAKKALKLAPTNEVANQTLVRVYEIKGSWKKMTGPLETLTQNYGGNSQYSAKLGEAHYRLKNYSAAIAPLQQAVNLNSTDYMSAYRLGDVQARTGDYDNAVSYMEQALSSTPSKTVKYYNMGLVYGYLKRHDEAISNFQLALDSRPGFAAAYYNIGAMYQNSQRLQEAIDSYDKALAIDSSMKMAQANRDYLKDYLERNASAGTVEIEEMQEETSQPSGEDAFEAPPEETLEEKPVEEESFDAVQEDTSAENESFDTAEETPVEDDSNMEMTEETPVEDTGPAEESFNTAEETPAEGNSNMETVQEETPAEESFETAEESGVESTSEGSESSEVTPVGTSEENPEVTPIGTSEDSFETSTGDAGAVEETTPEATDEATGDSSEDNSLDNSFRNNF